MADNARLAPSSAQTDPFATPTRSADYERSEMPAWNASPPQAGQAMEMQQTRGAPAAPPGAKPSFMQRWKAGDERLYGASIGRIGAGRRQNGEKSLVSSGGRRRRGIPCLCTIILAAALLVIIIAIVVPIAVVFGSKHNSSSSSPSTSSDSGGSNSETGSGDGGSNGMPQAQNSGIVTLQNGQYQGTNAGNGITSYLGLQYAAPPTGNLRFAAPQPPVNFTGIQPATKYAPGCHQLGPFNSKQDEDCLYLDVFGPTNVTSDSKLPVFVFIQGGGLQNADTHYNGTNLIVASGYKMITVTMTYRVNALGFLASKEIQKSGSLNNGLKDQRAAIQWVQTNIHAFGGDASRVVIAGSSAGAGSVLQQVTAYGGKTPQIFAGAIMQSQSVPPVRDVPTSQFQYDYIVGNTTCKDKSDTLSCLRGIGIQQLVGAIKNSPFPNGAGGDPVYPYNPVIDNDMVAEYPIDAFSHGNFTHVPMIFGDVTNEGTIFVDKNEIQTENDSKDYLRDTYPRLNTSVLDTYSSLYNFGGTGASDYWTHVAQAYGETRYTCPGIQLSNLATAVSNLTGKIWNYHYDVLDPNAAAQGLGVRHGSEMPAVWGATGAPLSYQLHQENANVIPVMQAYWTSFVKHLDPNAEKAAGAPTWDAWTGDNRIHVMANQSAMESVDSAQGKRCQFLNSIAMSIGQ